MPSNSCPLCDSESVTQYHYQKLFDRWYHQCKNCDLRFISKDSVLDLASQKEHYDQHQNTELSKGYKDFLFRLISPLLKHEFQNKKGLDFGSGPYPMLIELLKTEGVSEVYSYDPIYDPGEEKLLEKYDFVTCCEVVEHFVDVKKDCESLFNLVSQNGLLIISTGIFHEDIDFENWYYIRDLTHISIFSMKTVDFLAKKYLFEVVETSKDLIVLLKK